VTTRLPHYCPADLDEAQHDLYDAIVGGPRAAGPRLFALTDAEGRLHGPFNAMLAAPPVGQPLQQLGAAIRYETSLSGRVREMAILAVAAHWNSAFERFAHEPIGRAAGLSTAEIEALRSGGMPELADEAERAALGFVLALLRDGDVDDMTYASAVSAIGNRAAFELTTLVGYYATLALQLRVFRVGIPAGLRAACPGEAVGGVSVAGGIQRQVVDWARGGGAGVDDELGIDVEDVDLPARCLVLASTALASSAQGREQDVLGTAPVAAERTWQRVARRDRLRLPLEVVARFLLASHAFRQPAVAAVLSRDRRVGIPGRSLHPHAKLAVLPEIDDIARPYCGKEILVRRREADEPGQFVDACRAMGASTAIDGHDPYAGSRG
jgi:4-carboxymuconolactone decarboxylase